jgi:hypothetical protein
VSEFSLDQAVTVLTNGHDLAGDYLQPIGTFIDEEDPDLEWIFPDLLPCGVLMLKHGDPRARKSLAAFELGFSAATGTAPFGLERFKPSSPAPVIYVQEEDPRSLTRPRLRALVRERCGDEPPANLHVSVRRGISLDDPVWVERLIADATRLGAKLLILDAARRLSALTDEGPAKVRELTAVLRSIINRAGVSIVIVHHDVKPLQTGAQDPRRRGQRASGGDWFAASECPVHVERLNDRESLVFPQDYKFAADPAPFTFTCEIRDRLIVRLVGVDTSTHDAEHVGTRGKVCDWLKANGPATKTDMKRAGLGRWETIESALEHLQKAGEVDSGPGRKAGSLRYFVVGQSSPRSGDDSAEA